MPGTEDRGDDWTPTEDVAKPAAAPEVTKDDLKKVGIEADGDDAADESKAEADADPHADDDAGDDDEEGKDKDKGKKKSQPRIPLSRHKEILEREREQRMALERELANARQGQQIAATNEQLTEAENALLKLEETYAKQLTDGDADKASKTMAEIRRTERSIIEAKSSLAIQAAEARAYERVRYDTTVERLEAAYPALNPDHEDYDKDLTAEVVELRDAYVATGRYSRAEAIQKAAKTLMGTQTTRQERAVETEVRVDKAEVAKATAEERAKAARAKAAAAAAAQPPSTNRVGLDSDKLGALTPERVMKMSQDEFAKLDPEVLAKLRGDELV